MRSFGTETSGNRRPKAELLPEQRAAIIYGHELGQNPTYLVKKFNCSRSTIYRTLERYNK